MSFVRATLRRVANEGEAAGPCLPAKPQWAPPDFDEQRHKAAALPIFSQSLLTFATHIFQDVVFIQIHVCQFYALYTWQKLAFFCLSEVFCDPKIYQKCVSRTPLWELTALPSPLVAWRGHPSPHPIQLSAFDARSSAPSALVATRRLDPRDPRPSPAAPPLLSGFPRPFLTKKV